MPNYVIHLYLNYFEAVNNSCGIRWKRIKSFVTIEMSISLLREHEESHYHSLVKEF